MKLQFLQPMLAMSAAKRCCAQYSKYRLGRRLLCMAAHSANLLQCNNTGPNITLMQKSHHSLQQV